MIDPAVLNLAGVPRETLQLWLLEAQMALHQLSIGGKPESAAYTQGDGSKSITYTRANIGQIRMHIVELQAALGIRSRSRRAITPLWVS